MQVVALAKNRGPGGARNAGFEAAQGRWIAVLDSDDTVFPDRIARMIRRAENAGAEIAVDNLEVVHETTGRREAMFPRSSSKALPRSGLPISSPPIWCSIGHSLSAT